MAARDFEGVTYCRRDRPYPVRRLSVTLLAVGLLLLPGVPLYFGPTHPTNGPGHLVSAVPASVRGALLAPPPPLGDWSTYMYNVDRTGLNSNETEIAVGNVSRLTQVWNVTTSGAIESEPIVVGGRVYVSSWNGNEYAFNASNGSQAWRTFIGQTTFSQCNYSTARGSTSSATVVNDTLYVGGGDPYFYALNATTGIVEWKVSESSNSPSAGNYNWGSPIIYGSSAFVGISSACNTPGSQGMVLDINLNGTAHAVQHTFAVVGSGVDGGGVWSTGAVDRATNTLWVTTGDEVAATSGYYRSIIALNATNLSLVGYWKQPTAATDYDFGAGPTLFHDDRGRALVVATNKNGVAYALNRSNVSMANWGPVWRDNISWYANSSSGQQACGCALSPAAFDGSWLYLGGGFARLSNGTNVSGSVRAVYPSNGTARWIHTSPGMVRAGVTVANGLVYDAADQNNGRAATLEVLNASSGTRLFSYSINLTINAPPTVVDGRLFFTSAKGNIIGAGHVYAFALPLRTKANVPAGQVNGGTSVAFTQRSDGGSPPYSYHWDFGDASAGSTESAPSHVYLRGGSFQGTLVTTDAFGVAATDRWTMIVTGQNLTVLQFQATPNPVQVNNSILFTVTTRGGIGNLTFTYTGLPNGCASVNASALRCSPTSPGFYPVLIVVHDSSTDVARASTNITVTSPPPPPPFVAAFNSSPSPVLVGSLVWLNSSVTGGQGAILYAYSGLPAECPTADVASLSCRPTSIGSYTITLTVTDARHLSSTATTGIQVIPLPPIVPVILSFSAAPATVTVGHQTTLTVVLGGNPVRDHVEFSDLPAGCSTSNRTVLNCTPSVAGSFDISLLVTDLSGASVGTHTLLNVTTPAGPSGSPKQNVGGFWTPVVIWGLIAVLVIIAILIACWLMLRRRPTG